MRKINENLTYANVMATLAFFIAVGGSSAYAANQLSADSVGTKQLKNGSVTKAKLADGVNGAQGDRGPEGKQGTAGTPGSPGAPGKSAATHAVVRYGFGDNRGVAKCEPGEVATGGGAELFSEEEGVQFHSSRPVQKPGETPTEWEVTGYTPSYITPAELDVYVVCVSP